MNLQTPTAEEIYSAAAAAGARPDPMLTISQWADKYRSLSQRASAESGPWRTDRTPYLREIMDCLSPSSPVERTVFMKGAQIGGTECGNNWIGYVIHQAPGPMMAIQPTVEMAKRNSKQRIDPLIEESEVLRALVSDPRSRDSGNTVLSKEFPGGVLVMTGEKVRRCTLRTPQRPNTHFFHRPERITENLALQIIAAIREHGQRIDLPSMAKMPR